MATPAERPHHEATSPRLGAMTSAPTTRRSPIAAIAVALALIAAACGGSDSSTAEPVDGTTTTEASATTSADGETTTTQGDTEPTEVPTTEPAADTDVEAPPEVEIFYEGYESENYASDENWLCLPGKAESLCDTDLDVTLIKADGTAEVQPFEAATDPEFDCFYVYPTVSSDETLSSDFVVDEAERAVIDNQAARYGQYCDVYAPMYRQVTLAGLLGTTSDAATADPAAARELAASDVLDAWKRYMSEFNDGRGVVLVGHSQGTGVLSGLIADEIESNPAMLGRIVSAHLIGGDVAVPKGEIVGGRFAEMPLCTSEDESGCVVTYVSFRETAPPPEGSFFGDVGEEGHVSGCVNPAGIGEGPVPLHSAMALSANPPFSPDAVAADPALADSVTTPWVNFEGMLTGECVAKNGYDYLEIVIDADPSDPRADDIGGDLSPPWGLHLVDVNMAAQDLVDLASVQYEHWAASNR